MKFLCVLLSFSFLFAKALPAQTLAAGSDPQTSHFVGEILQKIVKPTVSLLPSQQREVLSSVEVVIVDGFNYLGPQAGFSESGNPVVFLPSLYLDIQHDYIWSVLIADAYGVDFFPEFWLGHVLIRLSSDFDLNRGRILLPADFMRLDDDEASELAAVYEEIAFGFYASALADIIFHELSHFLVDDGIYDWRTTNPERAIQIERSADDFSAYLANLYVERIAVGINNPDKFNLAGRLFSVGLTQEIQDFLKVSGNTNSRRYPTFVERINTPLKAVDCTDTALTGLCQVAQGEIARFGAREAWIDHYERRIDEGENFAIYRLSRYFWMGGDEEIGCGYLKFDEQMDKWATGERLVAWAWCLDKSLIWQSRSRGERLNQSTRYFCNAWKKGFNTYRPYKDTVDYLGWPDFCTDDG